MDLKGLFIKEEEQQNQEKPKEVAPTVASVIPTQTPTITTGDLGNDRCKESPRSRLH